MGGSGHLDAVCVFLIMTHDDRPWQFQSHTQIAEDPRIAIPRLQMLRTLLPATKLGDPPEVAKRINIHATTASRWEQRMQVFNGQIDCPEHLQMVSPSFLGGYFLLLSIPHTIWVVLRWGVMHKPTVLLPR